MAALTLRTVRPALVRLHRYAGLVLAGVLFIAGLTGSISVFRTELDAALNPDLYEAPAPHGSCRFQPCLRACRRSTPRHG